ncbi:glycine decarboxylase subunit H [Saccharomycopsis crataegensis]|uniref:Glycine cleavage system H protein n=1 Tax=Saccharomycopsis crataegensis TaxID=43959 RepID=A0AAV5QLM2_9ASCO|nr:glycine decarboxylase subunit H [Saccharomycopsis crataegensis]
MFASAFTRVAPRFSLRASYPLKSSIAFATKRFNSSASDLAAANSLKQGSTPFKFSAGPIVTKYTEEHEWVSLHPDGTAFIGITKYAADALGDATFVELPEVGDAVGKTDTIGAVESVKSASEVYAPVSGEVTEVNETVAENPNLLNEDPMGEGWLTQIKLANVEEDFTNNEELMTLEQYTKSLEEDH